VEAWEPLRASARVRREGMLCRPTSGAKVDKEPEIWSFMKRLEPVRPGL